MSKLVRVDSDTYRGLTCYAGRLQSRLGKPVSLNAALGYLVAKAEGRTPVFIRLLRQKKFSGKPKARQAKPVARKGKKK
jgi:hypothetical protein